MNIKIKELSPQSVFKPSSSYLNLANTKALKEHKFSFQFPTLQISINPQPTRPQTTNLLITRLGSANNCKAANIQLVHKRIYQLKTFYN